MKKVTFGMYREVYGGVTIDVPDDITEDNVVEYIKELIEKDEREDDFPDDLDYNDGIVFVLNTRKCNPNHIVFGDNELWERTPDKRVTYHDVGEDS